jgi:IS1 family transposase
MRKLSVEKRAAILNCLIEGLSIRATCRMTGAAKVTVLRLLADAGRVCSEHHDATVTKLSTQRIQADEAWGFVGCKDKAKKRGANGYGSAWTWVAQDADTKLVISFLVGQRDAGHANVFMDDVASRVLGRVQISTDALASYRDAVRGAFPNGVDFGVVVKTYASAPPEDQRRYSPSVCIGCSKDAVYGEPDEAHVSTSYIERQNRDLRMRCRRMTRLTDAFSKTIANHASAMALHYWAFNFVKKHGTLKTTPAVAAGIADRPLTTLDLAEMIEAAEAPRGGRRITTYLA